MKITINNITKVVKTENILEATLLNNVNIATKCTAFNNINTNKDIDFETFLNIRFVLGIIFEKFGCIKVTNEEFNTITNEILDEDFSIDLTNKVRTLVTLVFNEVTRLEIDRLNI